MGLVIDGELRRGARGAAGEVCYLPFGADPLDRANQTRGAFEEATSGAGIVERYRALGGGEATVPDIFRYAAKGEDVAVEVVDATARLLGRAICAIASVVDPGLIVLGGGIGAREELLEPVRSWTDRYLLAPPTIATSSLHHRASLSGAVFVALRTAHRQLFGGSDNGLSISVPQPANT